MIYGNEFILFGLWVISGKLSSEEKKRVYVLGYKYILAFLKVILTFTWRL